MDREVRCCSYSGRSDFRLLNLSLPSGLGAERAAYRHDASRLTYRPTSRKEGVYHTEYTWSNHDDQLVAAGIHPFRKDHLPKFSLLWRSRISARPLAFPRLQPRGSRGSLDRGLRTSVRSGGGVGEYYGIRSTGGRYNGKGRLEKEVSGHLRLLRMRRGLF